MNIKELIEKYPISPTDYRHRNTPRGWNKHRRFDGTFYEYSHHPIWGVWSTVVSILLSVAVAVVLFLLLPPFMAISILGLVTTLWVTIITHLTLADNGKIKLFGVYGIILLTIIVTVLSLSFCFSLSLGASAWLWGGLILVSLGFVASIVLLVRAKLSDPKAVLAKDLPALFLPIYFFFEIFSLLPTILYPVCFPAYKKKCERLNSLTEEYEKGFNACVRERAEDYRGTPLVKGIVKRLSDKVMGFLRDAELPEDEGGKARFMLSLYISDGKIFDGDKTVVDFTDLYTEPFESTVDFHAFCRALTDAIEVAHKKNAEVAVNFMDHRFSVTNAPYTKTAYIYIYLSINVPEGEARVKSEEI